MKRKYRYIKVTKQFVIIDSGNRSTYDIARRDIATASDVCKWLGQIEEKTWATPILLGELVQAMTDVVGDLRGI